MEEKTPNSINDLSQADWEKTPESVKRWGKHLIEQVEQLVGQVEQLKRQHEALKAENQRLKEQVQQNSTNSSKPPSQDLNKGFKVKEPKQSGKKRGAQPGHPGHERSLYPIEQCHRVEEHCPDECIYCGESLAGEDGNPYRIQIVEIPQVVAQVCEHHFHALGCQQCGGVTRAWDEAIINGSGYGERVVADVGVVSGEYRQSHRMVQELLQELFGIEISVGTINQLRQESSQSVSEAVIAVHQYVQAQGNANLDETSFAQGNNDGKNPTGCKGWMWVMVTPFVSYFEIFLARSQVACRQLLGDRFNGIVSSDRFSAYHWLELKKRQVCWAHLKRDFTRIAERSGVSGELGQALLAPQKLLFEQWHRVRDATLSRTQFITSAAPQEKTPLAKTVRTCQQLLKVEAALWTFVMTEGIEPTNNPAERALRPAVLWRKNSFGSQSEAGSLFVSRMLTVVTTLRSQNRPVLDDLVEACRAARQGQSAPSLLPVNTSTP